MKTAETIRTARERAKLTQEQAAVLTGYSRSAIQKFELGKRTPPARSLPMILSKLETACEP